MTPAAVNRILSEIFRELLVTDIVFTNEFDAYNCLMDLFMQKTNTTNKKTIIFATRQAQIFANKLYHNKYI